MEEKNTSSESTSVELPEIIQNNDTETIDEEVRPVNPIPPTLKELASSVEGEDETSGLLDDMRASSPEPSEPDSPLIIGQRDIEKVHLSSYVNV